MRIFMCDRFFPLVDHFSHRSGDFSGKEAWGFSIFRGCDMTFPYKLLDMMWIFTTHPTKQQSWIAHWRH